MGLERPINTIIEDITIGHDTSDADITTNDVISGKIGYGANGKVIGALNRGFPFFITNIINRSSGYTLSGNYLSIPTTSSLMSLEYNDGATQKFAGNGMLQTGGNSTYILLSGDIPADVNKIVGIAINNRRCCIYEPDYGHNFYANILGLSAGAMQLLINKASGKWYLYAGGTSVTLTKNMLIDLIYI